MATWLNAAKNAFYNLGVRQQQGQTGHTGNWGTQERGITETVSDFLKKANPINPSASYAQQPSSVSRTLPVYGPAYPGPQVQKVASSGGGGGGGSVLGASGQGIDRSNIDQGVQTGNDQIDRDYNDFMNQLSGSEGSLNTQAGIAGQELQNSFTAKQNAINTEGATKLAGNAQQGQVARAQEKTAMMEARDLFRQTQQSNIAQVAGLGISSSSVTQALSETLGVETARRIASVSQSANDIYQNLSKEKANIEGYVAEKLTEAESWFGVEKQKVQYSLSEGLRQINEARATAAKDKANRRADLLQSANDAIYKLTQDAQTFAQSLESWKAQNTSKIASLANVDWNAQFAQDLSSIQQSAGPNYDVSGTVTNNNGKYSTVFQTKPKKTEEEEDL